MERDNQKMHVAARNAMVLLCVFLVLMGAGFVYSTVFILLAVAGANIIPHAPALTPSEWVAGCASLLTIAGFLALFTMMMVLLRSIRRDASPFTALSVKRLKGISAVLAGMGAALFATDLARWLLPQEMPPAAVSTTPGAADASTAVYTVAFTAGRGILPAFSQSAFLLLAVAAVVWCVALAFAYGVTLQAQSDETL